MVNITEKIKECVFQSPTTPLELHRTLPDRLNRINEAKHENRIEDEMKRTQSTYSSLCRPFFL